jgi:ELWxxDGT repeat protein
LGKRSDGSGSFDQFGIEPHVSDGTPEGTRLLKDILRIPGDKEGSSPAAFTACGDKVVFTIRSTKNPADGGLRELWITDGTEAGTVKLLDLDRADDFCPVGGGVLYREWPGRILWSGTELGQTTTLFENAAEFTQVPFRNGTVIHATVGASRGFWWWEPGMGEPLLCGSDDGRKLSAIGSDGCTMLVIPSGD